MRRPPVQRGRAANLPRRAHHHVAHRPAGVEHERGARFNRRRVEGLRPDVPHVLADGEHELDRCVIQTGVVNRADRFDDRRQAGLVVGPQHARSVGPHAVGVHHGPHFRRRLHGIHVRVEHDAAVAAPAARPAPDEIADRVVAKPDAQRFQRRSNDRLHAVLVAMEAVDGQHGDEVLKQAVVVDRHQARALRHRVPPACGASSPRGAHGNRP